MTKYDGLCEMAVSNYGLVTAKTIDALGIHLKDVLEWVKSGRIENADVVSIVSPIICRRNTTPMPRLQHWWAIRR